MMLHATQRNGRPVSRILIFDPGDPQLSNYLCMHRNILKVLSKSILMKKSYLKCPYGDCGEITVSGMKMHVKKAHPEKYDEFIKNYDELKKSAIVKESSTRQPASAGEPPKVTPPVPPEAAAREPVKKEEPKKKGGDGTPKGEGFLDGVTRFLTEEDGDGF